MINILIADDHPLFRGGIRNLLKTTDDLKVVGEAGNGEEAIELAERYSPDVILMDISMPGTNGIEATRILTERQPHIQILIVSMFRDDNSVFAAMKAGARGYILKDAEETELMQAIRVVGNGGAVFSSDIAVRMMHFFSNPPVKQDQAYATLADLTSREQEILELIAEGESNGAIAARLHLSAKTVANYVTNILNKLQVADRYAAKRLLIKTREQGGAESV